MFSLIYVGLDQDILPILDFFTGKTMVSHWIENNIIIDQKSSKEKELLIVKQVSQCSLQHKIQQDLSPPPPTKKRQQQDQFSKEFSYT